MKEEFRYINIFDKICNWYSISNYGRLFSHLRTRSVGRDGFITFFDPEYKKEIVLSQETSHDGCIKSLYSMLTLPKNFFDGTHLEGETYGSKTTKKSKNPTIRHRGAIHRLVLFTFKPIDKYPPPSLEADWHRSPESFKQWVRETAYVNHIDHDPTNNHICNLEYVTPGENTRKAKIFYNSIFKKKSAILVSHSVEMNKNSIENFL